MSNGDMPGQHQPEKRAVEQQTEKRIERDSLSQTDYTPPRDAAAWDKIEKAQRRDRSAPATQTDQAGHNRQADRTQGEKRPEKQIEKDQPSQTDYTPPRDAAAWDKIETNRESINTDKRESRTDRHVIARISKDHWRRADELSDISPKLAKVLARVEMQTRNVADGVTVHMWQVPEGSLAGIEFGEKTVGPILLRHENGHIMGWMQASDLDKGTYREGNSLVWWNGKEIQAFQRYPEDPGLIKWALQKSGEEPSDRDVRTWVDVAKTANSVIESYLNKGLSLEDARARTQETQAYVFKELVGGLARALGHFTQFNPRESAIVHLMEGITKVLGEKVEVPSSGNEDSTRRPR